MLCFDRLEYPCLEACDLQHSLTERGTFRFMSILFLRIGYLEKGYESM